MNRTMYSLRLEHKGIVTFNTDHSSGTVPTRARGLTALHQRVPQAPGGHRPAMDR